MWPKYAPKFNITPQLISIYELDQSTKLPAHTNTLEVSWSGLEPRVDRVHYHNLGPQLGASLLTRHIGWKQKKKVKKKLLLCSVFDTVYGYSE
jgi:hypothetical protein